MLNVESCETVLERLLSCASFRIIINCIVCNQPWAASKHCIKYVACSLGFQLSKSGYNDATWCQSVLWVLIRFGIVGHKRRAAYLFFSNKIATSVIPPTISLSYRKLKNISLPMNSHSKRQPDYWLSDRKYQIWCIAKGTETKQKCTVETCLELTTDHTPV